MFVGERQEYGVVMIIWSNSLTCPNYPLLKVFIILFMCLHKNYGIKIYYI